MSKVVITFGTFDVFHLGHLRILQRARELGSRLVVGVSTDALSYSKKGRLPIYSESERIEIISSIKYVDDVFLEESLDKKSEYIRFHSAQILVMGDDWCGKFDEIKHLCEVVYLARTPSISTTAIIEKMKN
ncbi:adenylyltransferase/cytidyltransferase family protein [uncultured Zhongshania sp.]|uniref:adenylyltransferase/cytidyltransferase family protein n=1 Tax=uncultured Zhongshania sp. TaxID=1642288 RepID=UPI0025F05846|nr:adenylyltransferase/cytidyltransferase family protein [uncultured Zhongshania sp.]